MKPMWHSGSRSANIVPSLRMKTHEFWYGWARCLLNYRHGNVIALSRKQWGMTVGIRTKKKKRYYNARLRTFALQMKQKVGKNTQALGESSWVKRFLV